MGSSRLLLLDTISRAYQGADIRTTQVYTHALNRGGNAVRSPLNDLL